MTLPWLNSDNVSPQVRLKLALNCKEGVTPESVFDDWGDLEQDYPNTYTNKDHDADIDTFYQLQFRPNIRLIK